MFAIFIGFLGGLVTALIIERLKKPKLRLSAGPISDQVHGDIPIRFLYVRVENELLTAPIISWFISRTPALRARATIEFLRLDGSSVFARPMTARWSFSILPP